MKIQLEKMRLEKAEIESALLDERKQRTERENALQQTVQQAQAAGPAQDSGMKSGLSPFSNAIQQADGMLAQRETLHKESGEARQAVVDRQVRIERLTQERAAALTPPRSNNK